MDNLFIRADYILFFYLHIAFAVMVRNADVGARFQENCRNIVRAESRGIKAIGGMAMLVWQAVVAHEIWSGATYGDSDIEQLIEDMRAALAN